MIASGDEQDTQDDFYEDALNYIKHIDCSNASKVGYSHITQVLRTENESASSQSSHGDEADTEDNLQIISENSNMDFMDDPDSDFSDASDPDLEDWSDHIDNDDIGDDSLGESSVDDMSEPDIMDALTDYSEQDGDDEEDEEEETGPQVTIAIEVDNEHSDNSMGIMSSEGEEDNVIEFEPDDDNEEVHEINNRIIVQYDNEDYFDSSSDFEGNSIISQSSATSESSRSRSPIRVLRPSNHRQVVNSDSPYPGSVTPASPLPASVTPASPLPASVTPPSPLPASVTPAPTNDTESTVHVDVEKPSSSKSSTNETEDLGGDGLCCICLDSVSTHVVVPCGHICLCQHCKEVYESNDNHRRKRKCPLCKTPFSVIIKVYK